MNEKPTVEKSSMRNPFVRSRHLLLGTAIVLSVVFGYGVGSSSSKTESPDLGKATISVTNKQAQSRPTDDKIFRERKAGPDRRLTATEKQYPEMRIDPEKRRKLALLLLFAGGQVHHVKL